MISAMEEFSEQIKIIAEACLNDERILEVIRNIADMSEEGRNDFKSKVLSYFMKKTSPEDIEAYNFYKIILNENNAKKVIELYQKLCEQK